MISDKTQYACTNGNGYTVTCWVARHTTRYRHTRWYLVTDHRVGREPTLRLCKNRRNVMDTMEGLYPQIVRMRA